MVLRLVVEVWDVTLPPRGHLTMSRENFDWDCQWIKARDAAKYPIMPRAAPRNKELATPNARSTKVKDHSSGVLHLPLGPKNFAAWSSSQRAMDLTSHF